MPHRFKLPKIKKGMKSEQIAILYLIEKGYFVFKNLYGVGPADLIAINEKGALMLEIDNEVKPYIGGEISLRLANN